MKLSTHPPRFLRQTMLIKETLNETPRPPTETPPPNSARLVMGLKQILNLSKYSFTFTIFELNNCYCRGVAGKTTLVGQYEACFMRRKIFSH